MSDAVAELLPIARTSCRCENPTTCLKELGSDGDHQSMVGSRNGLVCLGLLYRSFCIKRDRGAHWPWMLSDSCSAMSGQARPATMRWNTSEFTVSKALVRLRRLFHRIAPARSSTTLPTRPHRQAACVALSSTSVSLSFVTTGCLARIARNRILLFRAGGEYQIGSLG